MSRPFHGSIAFFRSAITVFRCLFVFPLLNHGRSAAILPFLPREQPELWRFLTPSFCCFPAVFFWLYRSFRSAIAVFRCLFALPLFYHGRSAASPLYYWSLLVPPIKRLSAFSVFASTFVTVPFFGLSTWDSSCLRFSKHKSSESPFINLLSLIGYN